MISSSLGLENVPSDSPDRALSPKLVEVDYPGHGKFLIHATSRMIEWRASSFLEKEPTTIEWISSLESDSYLIDIGANIGIYTLPSALFKVQHVIAIEPELKNYVELIKNIELNEIEDKITALPLAISTSLADHPSHIFLTKDQPGMSCHQVGVNQDFKLNPIKEKRVKRSVYCISLKSIVNDFGIPEKAPLHIKIDVDGIEADVCESLFLSRAIERVTSLQIELNPAISSHQSLIDKLHLYGFSFLESQVNKAVRKQGAFKGFAEYVFRRRVSTEVYKAFPEDIKTKFTPVSHQQSLEASNHLLGLPCLGGFSPSIKHVDHLCLEKPQRVSLWPPVFILPKVFTSVETYSIYNLTSRSLNESITFAFETDKKVGVDDSRRKEISFDALAVHCADYKDLLKSKFCKLSAAKFLLGAMAKALRPYATRRSDLFTCNLTVLDCSLVCRVRHFVDFQGYYINQHNDSPDTLFTIILPLRYGGTATSLFANIPLGFGQHSPEFRMIKKEVSRGNAIKSSFGDNQSWLDPGIDGCLYRLSSPNDPRLSLDSKVFSSEVSLRHGDAIFIPNLNCVAVNKDGFGSLDYDLTSSGHGLFPPLKDLFRPVMIIDYVLLSKDSEHFSRPERAGEVFSPLCLMSEFLR